MKSKTTRLYQLSLLLSLFTVQAFGQYEYMRWEEHPKFHTADKSYSDRSAVVLEDFRFHEYKANEKDEMFVYVEQKKLIKVLDDKGVELFNKIYIYLGKTAEVLKIKARAIQPNGKVIDLPAGKILDVEEEGKLYKKFAMEGVEKNSEIEYYSMIRYPIYTFGIENFYNSAAPIQQARFTLCVPEHLMFDVKGYNGFNVGSDTLINKKRYVLANAENISSFEDEKYAVTDPFISNVQYKLSYNLAKDKTVRMYTWSNLARNIYRNYCELESKEMKAVENYFKKISLPSNATTEERIALIEDYVKKNIAVTDKPVSDDADLIEKIVKTKVAGHFGVTRLLVGLFRKAEIPATIVFPSKRNDTPIDEAFENFRLVDDIVLYFPATGKYLDPVNIALRYPFVDPMWAGTHGLFIKETAIGNIKSALAVFDSIPLEPYEENYSNLDVHLKLNSGMDTLLLKSVQSLKGYSAIYYRPMYTYLEKDKQDEFTKDVIGTVGKTDSITSFSVENADLATTYKNLPMHFKGEIKSVELLEKAGSKLLIKIGEVIGTQVQMYQEKQRQLPIVLQYPHALDRLITFTIPAGYRIKNLNDINIHITDKDAAGNETMGFISTYTLNDQELTIKLHEFYKSTYYPVKEIDVFRKVINAAADFNKVVLALEKI